MTEDEQIQDQNHNQKNKKSRLSEIGATIIFLFALGTAGYGIYGIAQVLTFINKPGAITPFFVSLLNIAFGLIFLKMSFPVAWNKKNLKRSIVNIIIVLIVAVVLLFLLISIYWHEFSEGVIL